MFYVTCALLTVLNILNVADALLTERALALGVAEAWPSTAALIEVFPEHWIAVKLLSVFVSSLMLASAATSRSYISVISTILSLLFVMVVAYNAVWLIHLGAL